MHRGGGRLLIAVMVLLVVSPFIGFPVSSPEPAVYKYFFYSPKPGVWLFVVGIGDHTKVEVFEIPRGGGLKLVNETVLDAFNVKWFWMRGGKFYLLVTNKRVSAGVASDVSGPIQAFYISTAGGLIGKEFVILSFGSLWVTAFDNSMVELFNPKGAKLKEFVLRPGEAKFLSTTISEPYVLLSTKPISVLHVAAEETVYLVSPSGRPVGRLLYGAYEGTREGMVAIIPYKPCKVSVYVGGVKVAEKKLGWEDVNASKPWFVKIHFGGQVKVVGTEPVSAMLAAPGLYETDEPKNLRGGAAVPVPANTTVKLFAVTRLIIYSPSKNRAEIDGGEVIFSSNSYLTLPGGIIHTIKVEKPVVALVFNRLVWRWGMILLSDKDLVFGDTAVFRSLENIGGSPTRDFLPVAASMTVIVFLAAIVVILHVKAAKKLDKKKEGKGYVKIFGFPS